MQRCQYCQAENSETARFCQNCGKSLTRSRFDFIRRHSGWFKALLFIFIFIILPILFMAGAVGSVASPSTQQRIISGNGKDKIALINIDGTISESGGTGIPPGSGSVTTRDVHDLLKSISEEADVKALIMRVNSPGGSAAASEEMYQELLRFKSTHNKKIVAYFTDVAASGGFYVSMAADKIIANPAVQTGNIGVITYLLNVQGLADRYGVKGIVYKSGTFKDIGNPLRQPTKEEDQIMQGMISEVFDRFVAVVAEGRKMDTAQVKTLVDGRIYTAGQAKALNLIDGVGDLETAIATTKELAGLHEATVVEFNRMGGLLEGLLGKVFAPQLQTQLTDRYAQILQQPGFLFLYTH